MSSYAKQIADAVVTVISGMASPPAATVLRKQDTLLKSDALFPMCVVTEPQELSVVCQAFGDGTNQGSLVRSYMIGMTVWRKHDGLIQTDVDIIPDLTIRIEQALNKGTLSGASSVCGTELIPFGYFETSSFKEGYEVSRARMSFSSTEPRNG